MDIDELKVKMRKKHYINKEKKPKNYLYKFSIKMLLLILFTISIMIALKKYPNFKSKFYKEVYENNISFVQINQAYKNIFGGQIPFSDYFESKMKPVFNEKLKYYKCEDYLDGVKLTVDKEYLVPTFESGMVIFIGDKDNYPNTVIIEQVNGIDVWYSNISNINVNLYDYIDAGELLGSSINDELYLVFKKNGDIIDYHEYI